MSQFWTDKEHDEEILQYCLDNFECVNIYTRLMGSSGGTKLVDEDLNGRKFSFKMTKEFVEYFIDGKSIIKFKRDNNKGFSIEYRHSDGFMMPFFYLDRDNPDDPRVPEDCLSALRMSYENKLIEITFKNKIPLFVDKFIYDGRCTLFHVKPL